MLRRLTLLVTGVAVLLHASPVRSGALGRLVPDTTRTILLEGRLTIHLPAQARIEPRQGDIMFAPPPAQGETRVVLDAGAERMVVMAHDLFATADHLELSPEQGRRMRGAHGRRTRGTRLPLVAGAGLTAIAAQPMRLDTTRAAVLVLDVQTRRPDSTLQRLEFFVNPAAARDPAGCRQLASRIAATLATGPQGLNLAAGQRELQVDSGLRFTLTAPAGYVVVRQRGIDFDVFDIRQLARDGDRITPRSLSLYVGTAPHPMPGADSAVRREPGSLLGQKIEWRIRTLAAGVLFVQAQASVQGRPSFKVHAFYFADNAEASAELRRIAESLVAHARPLRAIPLRERWEFWIALWWGATAAGIVAVMVGVRAARRASPGFRMALNRWVGVGDRGRAMATWIAVAFAAIGLFEVHQRGTIFHGDVPLAYRIISPIGSALDSVLFPLWLSGILRSTAFEGQLWQPSLWWAFLAGGGFVVLWARALHRAFEVLASKAIQKSRGGAWAVLGGLAALNLGVGALLAPEGVLDAAVVVSVIECDAWIFAWLVWEVEDSRRRRRAGTAPPITPVGG
jgi:hypothetical protein